MKVAWLTFSRHEEDIRAHLVFVAYHYTMACQEDKALTSMSEAIHCAASIGALSTMIQFVLLSARALTLTLALTQTLSP